MIRRFLTYIKQGTASTWPIWISLGLAFILACGHLLVKALVYPAAFFFFFGIGYFVVFAYGSWVLNGWDKIKHKLR